MTFSLIFALKLLLSRHIHYIRISSLGLLITSDTTQFISFACIEFFLFGQCIDGIFRRPFSTFNKLFEPIKFGDKLKNLRFYLCSVWTFQISQDRVICYSIILFLFLCRRDGPFRFFQAPNRAFCHAMATLYFSDTEVNYFPISFCHLFFCYYQKRNTMGVTNIRYFSAGQWILAFSIIGGFSNYPRNFKKERRQNSTLSDILTDFK